MVKFTCSACARQNIEFPSSFRDINRATSYREFLSKAVQWTIDALPFNELSQMKKTPFFGIFQNRFNYFQRYKRLYSVRQGQIWDRGIFCFVINMPGMIFVGEKSKKKIPVQWPIVIKANSTWCSQAVTHPSTNQAQRCLTSVIGRELVLSTWYGRWRETLGIEAIWKDENDRKEDSRIWFETLIYSVLGEMTSIMNALLI